MSKYIREDGKVAVIIDTKGVWYTRSKVYDTLFDPDLVSLILNDATLEEVQTLAASKYPDADFSWALSPTITWLDPETKFWIIHLSDGEIMKFNELHDSLPIFLIA